MKLVFSITSRPVHRKASKINKKQKNKHQSIRIILQATRSAADDRIGILIAGILRLAKRRRPPLTPRPAKI
jgi:hypothetical protein